MGKGLLLLEAGLLCALGYRHGDCWYVGWEMDVLVCWATANVRDAFMQAGGSTSDVRLVEVGSI